MIVLNLLGIANQVCIPSRGLLSEYVCTQNCMV